MAKGIDNHSVDVLGGLSMGKPLNTLADNGLIIMILLEEIMTDPGGRGNDGLHIKEIEDQHGKTILICLMEMEALTGLAVIEVKEHVAFLTIPVNGNLEAVDETATLDKDGKLLQLVKGGVFLDTENSFLEKDDIGGGIVILLAEDIARQLLMTGGIADGLPSFGIRREIGGGPREPNDIFYHSAWELDCEERSQQKYNERSVTRSLRRDKVARAMILAREGWR